ncbi:MAG TPA: divalent-cation tolerance protein CutA [Opitutaceae bacterium]|jgi:uncharacterized protein involved in tolerance to divalent cations
MPRKAAKKYCVITTTVSNAEVGERIAEALLDDALAACVQMFPIDSRYLWKGRIARQTEQMLVIKARRSDFAAVKKAVLKIHDYKVPEIILLAIEDGLGRYFDWIEEVTR